MVFSGVWIAEYYVERLASPMPEVLGSVLLTSLYTIFVRFLSVRRTPAFSTTDAMLAVKSVEMCQMKESGTFRIVETEGREEFSPAASDAAARGRIIPLLRRVDVDAHREQFDAAPTFPTPPDHLLRLAGADLDVASYLRSGHLMERSVYELIRSRSISVKEHARVLDFGCGSGRLTTWLHSNFIRWELHATDTHAEAVAWAQSNLKDVAQFCCNVPVPPLRYLDRFFDLTIALFVFTQPDDELQSEWFEELVRVTRPGGHLIVSVPERPGCRVDDAVPAVVQRANVRTCDWSLFYRTNQAATDFIRKAWGKLARIELIVPRWLNQEQALVICRRQ